MLTLKTCTLIVVFEIAYCLAFMNRDFSGGNRGLIIILMLEGLFMIKVSQFNNMLHKRFGKIPGSLQLRTSGLAAIFLIILAFAATKSLDNEWIWAGFFIISGIAKAFYVQSYYLHRDQIQLEPDPG